MDTPRSIRGIEPKLWKQLRAEAFENEQTVGELLNKILSKRYTTSNTSSAKTTSNASNTSSPRTKKKKKHVTKVTPVTKVTRVTKPVVEEDDYEDDEDEEQEATRIGKYLQDELDKNNQTRSDFLQWYNNKADSDDLDQFVLSNGVVELKDKY